MSLVLMMKSKYGLVAASDSKSTVSLGYGEELNRETQKIFAGENYLLATWGENRAYVDKWCKLEDILKKLVKKYPKNYKNIFEEFQNLIQGGPYRVYHFFVGFRYDSIKYPGNTTYIIEEYSVSQTGTLLHTVNDSLADCMYAGSIDMFPQKLPVNMNWSPKDLKEKATILLQSIINLGDVFLPYNPIGGKIQTKILI